MHASSNESSNAALQTGDVCAPRCRGGRSDLHARRAHTLLEEMLARSLLAERHSRSMAPDLHKAEHRKQRVIKLLKYIANVCEYNYAVDTAVKVAGLHARSKCI